MPEEKLFLYWLLCPDPLHPVTARFFRRYLQSLFSFLQLHEVWLRPPQLHHSSRPEPYYPIFVSTTGETDVTFSGSTKIGDINLIAGCCVVNRLAAVILLQTPRLGFSVKNSNMTGGNIRRAISVQFAGRRCPKSDHIRPPLQVMQQM